MSYYYLLRQHQSWYTSQSQSLNITYVKSQHDSSIFGNNWFMYLWLLAINKRDLKSQSNRHLCRVKTNQPNRPSCKSFTFMLTTVQELVHLRSICLTFSHFQATLFHFCFESTLKIRHKKRATERNEESLLWEKLFLDLMVVRHSILCGLQLVTASAQVHVAPFFLIHLQRHLLCWTPGQFVHLWADKFHLGQHLFPLWSFFYDGSWHVLALYLSKGLVSLNLFISSLNIILNNWNPSVA